MEEPPENKQDWTEWDLDTPAENCNTDVIIETNIESPSLILEKDSDCNHNEEEIVYTNYDGSSDNNQDSTMEYLNDLMPSPPDTGQEGLEICERCGAKGTRHAFYGKSKRFCSLSCSRSYATAQREGKPLQIDLSEKPIAQVKPGPPKKKTPPKLRPQTNTIPATYSKQNATRSFDWSAYLNTTGERAADVMCFPHAPLSDIWEHMIVGMKVEVLNRDYNNNISVYWIAAVVKIAGYKALMRYEGYGADSSQDFWINLCDHEVHPVGWCATIGNPLVPPKGIQHKYTDWKEFLVKRLTGARTLPNHFFNKVVESFKDCPFHKGMLLEVVDKMCVSAMKVAKIDDIIAGRLRLQYINGEEDNDNFWCHSKSALIHHVGWSLDVSHKLHAGAEYTAESMRKISTNVFGSEDCRPDMFFKFPDPPSECLFEVGMKLEAIDPLNLSTICVATIKKVLNENYIMIGIDGSTAPNGSDWFCYHVSSPSIFPVGFCEINNIPLTSPKGYKGEFHWFDYLKASKSIAAPVKLFNKEIPSHGFKSRMKLEAVDLMEPRLICVGSIVQVVGRLLKVHFDGWESAYDQWVDCQSPDIYPVGWCEMVGYHLEGPKTKETYIPLQIQLKQSKKKARNQSNKGVKKKRKIRLSGSEKGLDPSMEWEENNRFGEEGMDTQSPEQNQQEFGQQINSNASVLNNNISVRDDNSQQSKVLSESDCSQIKDLLLKPRLPCMQITGGALSSGADTMNKGANITSSPSIYTHLKHSPGVTAVTQSVSPMPVLSNLSPTQYATSQYSIPRLVADDNELDVSQTIRLPQQQVIVPELWTVGDVCKFLKINSCGPFCEGFSRKNIDGKKFLTLSKEQIVNLTGMKVGPSLKIYELIQQLKGQITNQIT